MKRQKISSPFNGKSAFTLAITIGVLVMIVMIISYFHAKVRDVGRGLPITQVITWSTIIVFILNIFLLYLLFSFQFRVIRSHINYRKKSPVIVLGSLLIVIVVSPVFANIHWLFFVEHIPSNIFLSIFFVKDMILAIISLLFTAIMYMWEERQKTLLANKELVVENIQNRYDALKNQVDPHFLFNSLNTLNGLIGFDDEKAHDYVGQLSSVFRYTMQNKPIIQLTEEVEFAQSYTYLMKIRYGDSLHIEYHIDQKYLDYYILPFGIQLLVENAVKHNVVTNKRPLTLIIETTSNDTIRAINNIQPKAEQKSGGVGLANLNERYQLMFNKEVSVSRNEDFFTVEIPLIKEIGKKDINLVINDYESSNS